MSLIAAIFEMDGTVIRRLDDPQPLPGAVRLVKSLAEYMPVAVISPASPDQVKTVIQQLGLKEHITAAAVDLAEAAKSLDVNPRGCAVFTSGRAGVEAGKEAGMYVVACPTEFTTDQDFSLADLQTNSLEDIAALTMEEILMERIGKEG